MPASFPRRARRWYVSAMRAMSFSANSRWVRSTMLAEFERPSMNSKFRRGGRWSLRPLLMVAGQEPQAGWNLGRVEELSRQCYHAVHELRFDRGCFRILPSPDCMEDMEPFASTNPALPPGWPKMMDDMLYPGKVGVTLSGGVPRICQRLSSGKPVAAPLLDIERRISKDEVGLEVRDGGRCGSCRPV